MYISNKLNANAYIYCWNCPVAFGDAEGTTPKLSVNLTDIIAFLKAINNAIQDKIKEGLEKAYNKLIEIRNKITEYHKKLIKKYNSFIDKVEYFLNYPDAVINKTLSKILNKEVKLKFRLIEYLRNEKNLYFDLSAFKKDVDEEKTALATSNYSVKSKSNSGNGFGSAAYVVSVIINEIFVCLDLQKIARKLKKAFDFKNLKDYMKMKTELYSEWFDSGNLWTAATDAANKIAGYVSLAADFIPKWEIRAAFALLPYATSALKDFSGRYLSATGGLIMLLYDWFINFTVDISAIGASGGNKKSQEIIMNILFGKFFDIFASGNVENYAYNWYLM